MPKNRKRVYKKRKAAPDPDVERISAVFGSAKTPLDLSLLDTPYAGIPTFFRVPYQKTLRGVDIALIGVPFDGGVTNRAGARHGPRAIRDHSPLAGLCNHQTQQAPFFVARVADAGDVPLRERYSLDRSVQEIERFYRRIVSQGILPVSAGGDHSITYPILRAVGREEPVGLVHFDSHCDTGPAFSGSRFHHGGPFRNAVEAGVLDPRRTIQVGIRGRSEVLWDFSYESGMRVVHIEEFYEKGWKKVLREIRTTIGDGPAYVSVDIDCLDPAFAPGTGTPEVGGMTPFELQQVLRGMQGMNVIGGDVVEVAPPFDPGYTTALAGAAMMFEVLCLVSGRFNRKDT